jgi:hypothetical protein
VNVQQKPYGGTKEHYKGMTFITFRTEDSAGIVIPARTQNANWTAITTRYPYTFFFKTTREVFASETKKP